MATLRDSAPLGVGRILRIGRLCRFAASEHLRDDPFLQLFHIWLNPVFHHFSFFLFRIHWFAFRGLEVDRPLGKPGGLSFTAELATECSVASMGCPPALPEARLWEQRCGCYCCLDCWGCYEVPQRCPERYALPVLPLPVLLGLSQVFFVFLVFVVLPAFRIRTNEPAGVLRFMHPCQPRIPAEPGVRNSQVRKHSPSCQFAYRKSKISLCSVQVPVHQLPCPPGWPEGCGLAPFDTSLPGLPLFDGPNPLGAIRSSNSSTSSFMTSRSSFILTFCFGQRRSRYFAPRVVAGIVLTQCY